MTKNTDVIAAHDNHPEWTVKQIADHLGCDSAYVRATAQRKRLKHTSDWTRKNSRKS